MYSWHLRLNAIEKQVQEECFQPFFKYIFYLKIWHAASNNGINLFKIIVINNRNYNLKGIINNYNFCHNRAALATHHIDTLGPIWTFSLRGVLTFVASGLDINGCVLSYFEGTANLHCYTSCTLTTLHCSKVSFLQCCHMKRYNKIFTKMWGVYSLLWDTVNVKTSK